MVDTVGTVADLKASVFRVEREDMEDRGTRSIGGLPLRWSDPARRVQAREAAEVVREGLLLWALCHKDLPTGVNDYVATGRPPVPAAAPFSPWKGRATSSLACTPPRTGVLNAAVCHFRPALAALCGATAQAQCVSKRTCQFTTR